MLVHEHSYERCQGDGPEYAISVFGKLSNQTAVTYSFVVIHQGGFMVRVSKWHEVDL